MIFEDKGRYQGEFFIDKMHGTGVYTYPDGRQSFTSVWTSNIPAREGVWIDQLGAQHDVVLRDGVDVYSAANLGDAAFASKSPRLNASSTPPCDERKRSRSNSSSDTGGVDDREDDGRLVDDGRAAADESGVGCAQAQLSKRRKGAHTTATAAGGADECASGGESPAEDAGCADAGREASAEGRLVRDAAEAAPSANGLLMRRPGPAARTGALVSQGWGEAVERTMTGSGGGGAAAAGEAKGGATGEVLGSVMKEEMKEEEAEEEEDKDDLKEEKMEEEKEEEEELEEEKEENEEEGKEPAASISRMVGGDVDGDKDDGDGEGGSGASDDGIDDEGGGGDDEGDDSDDDVMMTGHEAGTPGRADDEEVDTGVAALMEMKVRA